MLVSTTQHFKIVDQFLELPGLWRSFALQQEYTKDQSGYPGKKSIPLDELNLHIFHSLAAKIIKHVNGKNNFQRLKVQFACTTEEEFSKNIHQDEPFYNVAGVIYLSENPPQNTGTLFYNKTPAGEIIKTLTVENVYNRMIIFNPSMWHSQAGSFGTDLKTSRLTITFFGVAV
jgi:hypothetical protein